MATLAKRLQTARDKLHRAQDAEATAQADIAGLEHSERANLEGRLLELNERRDALRGPIEEADTLVAHLKKQLDAAQIAAYKLRAEQARFGKEAALIEGELKEMDGRYRLPSGRVSRGA